jgi:hypothetical protein
VIQVNEMIEVVVTHSPHKSKVGSGELFDQAAAFYLKVCFILYFYVIAPKKNTANRKQQCLVNK